METTTRSAVGVRNAPPFRADHVGSFLRPKFLLDAREQFRNGAIDGEQLRAVENEAIRGIVKFQEDLGLRGITDEAHAEGDDSIADDAAFPRRSRRDQC